ncbi:MAG: hypothetical protein M1319_02230 [Chloroflexi bacterium]|nr:hypothetical protein [Chloroflexota bacterium]
MLQCSSAAFYDWHKKDTLAGGTDLALSSRTVFALAVWPIASDKKREQFGYYEAATREGDSGAMARYVLQQSQYSKQEGEG